MSDARTGDNGTGNCKDIANSGDDDRDQLPQDMVKPVAKWRRFMSPVLVVLLYILALGGILELWMQIYDRAYAAIVINATLFLLTMYLGRLGAFVAVTMVWGVWAILHFLVVMNVIKIGGLSQSSAFMGAANVAFLYPQPHEPRSTATFTIAPVTALPTSRVIAATGTVPVSASVTTEGFIASPTSLVAPASTIFSSIIPVDATTVAPIVKKDDATAIASKRQETQPVIAMQTPTNYQPLPSTEEPMLIGLAQFFGCIIHVLASIFAVICALLMPNNTLKLTRAQEVHSEDGL